MMSVNETDKKAIPKQDLLPEQPSEDDDPAVTIEQIRDDPTLFERKLRKHGVVMIRGVRQS